MAAPIMSINNPLEKDLAAFEEKREELQQQHPGKFAVFFEGQFRGAFESSLEAHTKGYETAGLKPFLVRQITPVPSIQHFTRALRFKCLTSA
jgi:hypothetical protein